MVNLCNIKYHINNSRTEKCKLKIMIKIDLKLFVTLSKYHPKGGERLEIPEEITVEKLMVDLGIPLELVKLIFINGKMQKSKYRLKHNDRVGLFPPVGGG